jgi:hypothetical protein
MDQIAPAANAILKFYMSWNEKLSEFVISQLELHTQYHVEPVFEQLVSPDLSVDFCILNLFASQDRF